MQINQKGQQQFLNPYRENKRCFTKYFKKNSNIDLSLNDNSHQNHEGFLDNISKASSLKYRDQSVQNHSLKKIQAESSLQESHLVIINKRKINELQNPQIFVLLSKHIQKTLSNINKPKKTLLKPVNSILSERLKIRSNSVVELEKIPKITEFSRQTFYRNPSSLRRDYSSKKQKQDILHSKINLDINAKKHTICKKTRPFKDSHSFVAYEIYDLNGRVGIDVQILAGVSKQIKFRLIMNQNDTKSFQRLWIQKIDEFIDKCLTINEDGILLKVGAFNLDNITRKKSSKIKQIQKIYLEQYEALQKRKKNKSVIKENGNANFSQVYEPRQGQEILVNQTINQNLEINSNKKQINEKKSEQVVSISAEEFKAEGQENENDIKS